MSILLATQQTQLKPKRTVIKVDNDAPPVTCQEASQVFGDARRILSRTIGANLPSSSISPNARPVSREQVVSEMAAITRSLASKIKFTPKPADFSPSVFRMKSSQMENLKVLVRLGYVGKVSPLATNSTDTLTIRQFGDALGFFVARTAELTHMPSPKWSPILGAGT